MSNGKEPRAKIQSHLSLADYADPPVVGLVFADKNNRSVFLNQLNQRSASWRISVPILQNIKSLPGKRNSKSKAGGVRKAKPLNNQTPQQLNK